MQGGFGRCAGAGNIARIRRNFWINEYDSGHGRINYLRNFYRPTTDIGELNVGNRRRTDIFSQLALLMLHLRYCLLNNSSRLYRFGLLEPLLCLIAIFENLLNGIEETPNTHLLCKRLYF